MTKAIRATKRKTPAAAAKKPAARTGTNWPLLLLLAGFTALATFGLFEFVILSKVPAALIGKWVVVAHDIKPNEVGLTKEFHRDGSMGILKDGMLRQFGAARVAGDRLYITIFDRPEKRESFLLIYLTETRMVLEIPPHGSDKGGMMTMERSAADNH